MDRKNSVNTQKEKLAKDKDVSSWGLIQPITERRF